MSKIKERTLSEDREGNAKIQGSEDIVIQSDVNGYVNEDRMVYDRVYRMYTLGERIEAGDWLPTWFSVSV